MSVFILDLYTDDRTAVLMHIPFRLLCDFGKKDIDISQILWIVRPQSQFSPSFLLHQPVREASVSALSMGPRTDAEPYLHSHFPTAVKKGFQVPPFGKIPFSFRFLMMDPEDISGCDLHSAQFHILQGRSPLLFRIAGEMEFSHDGQDRSVVAG